MKAGTPARRNAFTLIETVIAVGIVATAIAGLLLLVPNALGTISESGNRSTQARIAQGLIAEMLLNGWGTVDVYDETDRYFDIEGEELTKAGDAAAPEGFAFHAHIEFVDREISLPAATSAAYRGEGVTTPDMYVANVHITNAPIENYEFDGGKRHRTFSTWITRMDL